MVCLNKLVDTSRFVHRVVTYQVLVRAKSFHADAYCGNRTRVVCLEGKHATTIPSTPC
jgi:hypothetical protein